MPGTSYPSGASFPASELCVIPNESDRPRRARPLRWHAGKEGSIMLETLAVVLLLLWAVGLVTSYTLSGFVHILLVAAIVVVLVRVIQGRRPV
jgi:hypothetical protein